MTQHPTDLHYRCEPRILTAAIEIRKTEPKLGVLEDRAEHLLRTVLNILAYGLSPVRC